jgi:pimeloyl-ACP methyl ester carboxylesterase
VRMAQLHNVFGAPLPDDFPATHLAYRDWLEGELERIGEPVDLVGHDWGGLHVVNVAMHRPELLRSWASDDIGIFDDEYVWHDIAQVWQTPGAGEEFVEIMMGAPAPSTAEQLCSPTWTYLSTSRNQSPRRKGLKWAGRSRRCTGRPPSR